MQSQKANWVQYVTGVLVIFLALGFLGGYYTDDVEVVTEEVVFDGSCDLTNVTSAIDNVQYTLDEEDNWKDEAIELATDEWSKSDYKYLYRFLEDIDEKDDIRKVVIKDSEVTSFDVDDQDAVVYQELKVYYENLDGDDVKVYVFVESVIEDGDVEDFEFYFE